MTKQPSTTTFFRRRNRHRFEPFFESDGACWCGKGRNHYIHGDDRHLLDTPLGALLYPDDAARKKR